MEKGEQRVHRLNVYLMKDSVKDFRECIKADYEKNVEIYDFKESAGVKGIILVANNYANEPEWKIFLDEFSSSKIQLKKSVSNKVVFLIEVKGRIMAIVFGRGKSLLDDAKIENDFGIKTALGIVNPSKIRSLDAATVESMIIMKQQQANYLVDKDEFSHTYDRDILLAVNGLCRDNFLAQRVNGRDSVVISAQMEPNELYEKLAALLNVYKSEEYMANFSAIDNVRIMKDPQVIDALNNLLTEKIKSQEIEKITVAPPANIDWEDVVGFMITGARKKREDVDNYSFEVDLKAYLAEVSIQSIDDLKKRDLLCMYSNGEAQRTCSLYRALSTEIDYKDQLFVLFDAKWYAVNNDFAKQVRDCVKSISISNINLPQCEKNESESDYNIRVADNNLNIALGDKIMCNVNGAPRQIEAFDLITDKKQFIHVKKHTKSSMLSHLFSQGRVAAMCFVDDEIFRRNVYQIVKEKLNYSESDFIRRPQPHEIEVVYALITPKRGVPVEIIPFFSLVNLMLAYKDLARMNVKCSLRIINEV